MLNIFDNNATSKSLEKKVKKRIVGYLRISTKLDSQAQSIENQRLSIINYAEKNNYEIVGFYSDYGTGTNAKRSDFQNLLRDITRDKFDIIITKELSRIARNTYTSHDFKNRMEENQIDFITLDGLVNTLSSNVDIFAILAWVYELESKNTSTRIKSSLQVRMQLGEFVASVAPYGYIKKNKKLYIRGDETTKIVKEIYSKYLNGWGVEKIAKDLTNRGISTSGQISGRKNAGQFWHGSTIKLILSNPHFTGNLVQSRKTTLGSGKAKRKLNSPNDYIIKKNTHEAIIDEDTFNQVQRLLNIKTKRGKGKWTAQKHVFTNILKCNDCGKNLWYRENRQGYICGTYAKHGKKYCSSHHINESTIIDKVREDLIKYSKSIAPSNLEKKANKHLNNKLNYQKKDSNEIKNKINIIKGKKFKTYDAYISKMISKDEYETYTTNYKKELMLLEKDLDSLNNSDSSNESIINSVETRKIIEKVLTFESIPKEVIPLLIDEIVVYDNKSFDIKYSFIE